MQNLNEPGLPRCGLTWTFQDNVKRCPTLFNLIRIIEIYRNPELFRMISVVHRKATSNALQTVRYPFYLYAPAINKTFRLKGSWKWIFIFISHRVFPDRCYGKRCFEFPERWFVFSLVHPPNIILTFLQLMVWWWWWWCLVDSWYAWCSRAWPACANRVWAIWNAVLEREEFHSTYIILHACFLPPQTKFPAPGPAGQFPTSWQV